MPAASLPLGGTALLPLFCPRPVDEQGSNAHPSRAFLLEEGGGRCRLVGASGAWLPLRRLLFVYVRVCFISSHPPSHSLGIPIAGGQRLSVGLGLHLRGGVRQPRRCVLPALRSSVRWGCGWEEGFGLRCPTKTELAFAIEAGAFMLCWSSAPGRQGSSLPLHMPCPWMPCPLPPLCWLLPLSPVGWGAMEAPTPRGMPPLCCAASASPSAVPSASPSASEAASHSPSTSPTGVLSVPTHMCAAESCPAA